MAKIDTINKYAEAYLAGKNEKAVERFYAKSVDKQYQSIMTWRYNMRKRGGQSGLAQEARDIIEELRGVRRRIDRCKQLDEHVIDEVETEMQSLSEFLVATRRRLREEEIARLEDRRAEIQTRLDSLRENL